MAYHSNPREPDDAAATGRHRSGLIMEKIDSSNCAADKYGGVGYPKDKVMDCVRKGVWWAAAGGECSARNNGHRPSKANNGV